MSEKKNIDRLFQEKFKDFEATPPEFVWENIEAELKEKKKRRVIPIWFKLGGVAAVLLLGLMLINPFNTEIETDNNPIVNSNGTNSNNANTPNKTTKGTITGKPNINPESFGTTNAVVTSNKSDKNNSGKSGNDVTSNNNSDVNNSFNTTTNNSAFNNNGNAVVSSTTISDNKPTNGNNPTATANKAVNSHQNNTIDYTDDKNQATIAYNGKTDTNNTNKENGGIANKPNKANSESNSKTNSIDGIAENKSNETGIAQNGNDTTTVSKTNTQDEEDDTNNSIINKEIPVEEAVADVVVDTASVVLPENELEQLLQEKLNGENEEKEDVLAEEDAKKKWNVKPQVAPVFYNSLSDGSPINSDLANNSKDYDSNMSFGVGIDYAVTDRISIRSGINTVNLSYSTQGVEFFPSMTEQTSNISARNTASRTANLVVQNEGTAAEFGTAFSQETFRGSMLQEMGYIEVPVEMSYALVNKKFGIDVIGGFSTLFLNDNNVSVVTDQGLSATLGEANNLNSINFSTNIGIGFKYRFLKSFQASFEPTFKYQLNTFSGNSGNFRPYFIGLYSGVSFSF
ncbi:hypothetical protein [Flavobacterium litorale]|uniref:Outer membrane protein beta-barrel domain-containing protein n=1 Tax=Flavobacterium litorale TaxID=2856519 RepID=A0ABX8V8D1_9FLAO|nr:hypothetical protein [Flavobacterium litorale]QYJ69105.1 hypothetical protein K1I41_04235 [Flavobacterium litorale]